MWPNISLHKCVSFVESQFRPKPVSTPPPTAVRPAVTISRMTGAGGHTVASGLAGYLESRLPACGQWTVFDQNLVEKVLEDHNISRRIADFMQESGRRSMIYDSVEEWIGIHPSSWTLQQQSNATILHLARMGNVILVGRGGMVITRRLQNVLHVRLVGSPQKRIKRVEHVYGLDEKEAIAFIAKKDQGRRRYLKDNFDVDANDPLLYHLTINTDLVEYDEAARLIGDALIKRFSLERTARTAEHENRLTH